MTFGNIDSLSARLRELGATRIFCKALAENDNSKQQIYLGGSFEVLKLLPHREVRSEPGLARPNFKAGLAMAWVDDAGNAATAPGAQLILYPDYPEVRLSGFLQGCSTAPSQNMRPLVKSDRRHNNGPDGRVLFFGVSDGGVTYAYLALAGSAIANEFVKRRDEGDFVLDGVLWNIPGKDARDSRFELLTRLRSIHGAGWHASQRLDKAGRVIPYSAQNGGGYTLEALLGIRPNAKAAPDFMGWEVKAYGIGKVTLMTPEPDEGYYGKNGTEAFVRKYGRAIAGDVMYFTGIHRVNQRCDASGQTLVLRGFDASSKKIVDVSGGIDLIDSRNNVSAGWSFPGLIEHWSRKHSAAVYVPYTKKKEIPPEYRYNSPVLLGEGTDFSLYLSALANGQLMYDPASKVMAASSGKSSIKPRNQFRIPIKNLSTLYTKFEAIKL